MSPDKQKYIDTFKPVRQIGLVFAISFLFIIILLTTTQLYAQTATLPPGTNTFDIALQSTIADVDYFELVPPYLYTVHDTTFTAYDVSNPAAPAAINSISLLSVTSRFEYSGTLAYLLQEQSSPIAAISNSELWILDLATPADMITKTVYSMTEWNNNPNAEPEYPFHDAIADIAPFDEYLLISHIESENVGFFGGSATLTLLDLSTAPAATVVSTKTISGAIYDMQIYGNHYLIGQRTTFYGGRTGYVHEYYLFDYANKLEPIFVDRYGLKRPDYTPIDLFIDDNQTYAYTIEYPKQAEVFTPCEEWTPHALHIRNITEPTTPIYEGFYTDPTYPGEVTCDYDQLRPFYTVGGHSHYMAAAIDDQLYLLDRTDPTHPFALGNVPVDDNINELQISNGLVAARTNSTIQLYQYAEAATQSQYLTQSIDHRFFINQMGFYVPRNSFTQPISFTVQTFNLDQTNPITESLYATHALYRISAIVPVTGNEVTPATPVTLDANYDSLNFGRPLDGAILGNTLSFYRWKNGEWQKVPSTVVNGDTTYPTVSAQVDQLGLYVVMAEKEKQLFVPLIQR